MLRTDFKRIDEYLWEAPRTLRVDMRVPARIYASEEMLERVSVGEVEYVAIGRKNSRRRGTYMMSSM